MTLAAWKALILILFEQLAILVVLLLTAWESAQEQRRNRAAQARLETRLVELNARLGERTTGARDRAPAERGMEARQ